MNEATSLFSNRVRELTQEYKDEILNLETQIRQTIYENFGYLNTPEKGRIGKIVEKHINQLNAEILGIKEEMTAFELGDFRLPNDCTMLAMLRPTSMVNDGSLYRNMHSVLAATQYDLSIFKKDKSQQKLIFHSPIAQMINGFGFGDANLEDKLNIQLKTTGSGAIPNRGQQPSVHDIYHGGSIPASGFYRMSSAVEKIAGGVTYRTNNEVAIDANSPNKTPNVWRSAEGDALRMWRVNAEGVKTNETNSDIRLQNFNGLAKARIGDFVATARIYLHDFSGFVHGHHNMVVDDIVNAIYHSHVGIPPLTRTLALNMNDPVTWSRMCNIFVYYWTWQDECPTQQDVENLKSLYKQWNIAYYRAYYQRAPEWQLDNRARVVTYDLCFPKGCYHDENTWRVPAFDWSTGNEFNGEIPNFLAAEQDGGRWTRNAVHNQALRAEDWPRYPMSQYGNTTAQQNEDREWYRKAKARGEPVIDINEFFRFYGTSLQAWIKLGRFARDQQKYHTAVELASQVGASEAEKKNAQILKNWFYTKWEEFRNTQGTDEVEKLSSKIMELIESV